MRMTASCQSTFVLERVYEIISGLHIVFIHGYVIIHFKDSHPFQSSFIKTKLRAAMLLLFYLKNKKKS